MVGLDAHLAAVESDLTVYMERGPFAETVGRLSAYRGISGLGALTLSVVIKPGATGTVLLVEDQDAEHPESILPATARRRPLLIAGIPRTGSTWTKVILSHDPSILQAVNEPDSETKSAPAIWAKRRLGRYPVLAPGDRDADYQELWRWVLAGTPQSRRLQAAERVRKVALKEWRWYVKGRWTPTMRLAGQLGRHPGDQPVPELRDRRLLVKSVHAAMSVQWLAATFDLEVLVLLRHPAAVLASWQSLGLPEQYVRLERVPEVRRRCEEWGVPLPGPDELEHTVWLLGVLLTSLEQAARDSGFALRTHEQMCLSPVDEFRSPLPRARPGVDGHGSAQPAQSQPPGAGLDRGAGGPGSARPVEDPPVAGDCRRHAAGACSVPVPHLDGGGPAAQSWPLTPAPHGGEDLAGGPPGEPTRPCGAGWCRRPWPDSPANWTPPATR